MNETKSYALYTVGNNIVGIKFNNKRTNPAPVPIRTDYLSDLQFISTDNEIYYLYKNIADKWCLCSVFEDNALLLAIDNSTNPSLLNINNEPVICQLIDGKANFIFPLTPSKSINLTSNENDLNKQKEYYENLIVNLKADFNLQLNSKDEYYTTEIQKLKDTHESVLSNIQDQYDDLAAMAEDLQKEGKMWREKYFKR